MHTLSFGYENILAAEAAGPILPHGGTDESGKGDFFGPLVVASCFVTEETGKELIVNDGNTYIQIYPTSGSLNIS